MGSRASLLLSALCPEEGKTSLERDDEPGMMAHAYNPFMRQRQEDCCKLEDNLGYIVSSGQKPSLPKIKEILFHNF